MSGDESDEAKRRRTERGMEKVDKMGKDGPDMERPLEAMVGVDPSRAVRDVRPGDEVVGLLQDGVMARAANTLAEVAAGGRRCSVNVFLQFGVGERPRLMNVVLPCLLSPAHTPAGPAGAVVTTALSEVIKAVATMGIPFYQGDLINTFVSRYDTFQLHGAYPLRGGDVLVALEPSEPPAEFALRLLVDRCTNEGFVARQTSLPGLLGIDERSGLKSRLSMPGNMEGGASPANAGAENKPAPIAEGSRHPVRHRSGTIQEVREKVQYAAESVKNRKFRSFREVSAHLRIPVSTMSTWRKMIERADSLRFDFENHLHEDVSIMYEFIRLHDKGAAPMQMAAMPHMMNSANDDKMPKPQ